MYMGVKCECERKGAKAFLVNWCLKNEYHQIG